MLPVSIEKLLDLEPDAAAQALLEAPESQWLERKSGSIKPADLAVPLSAMANAEGGYVIAGLSENKIHPVSDRAANDLRQAAIDFTRPRVRVHVRELQTSTGRVLAFRVSPGEQVHETTKGDCFVRIGDESRRLSFTQRQELEWDRGVACFEGTEAQDTQLDDLDDDALAAFAATIGSSEPTLALDARDLVTRSQKLTVAATLLFARRPQTTFPSAHVRVLRYTDNERGAGNSQTLEAGKDFRCEGPIPAQIDQAARVVAELMPQRRALTASGRFEGVPLIPRDAWLEGLVNAVVHRSYSNSGDHVRVEIFPSRIEITSPGRFPGLADPAQPQSIGRNARNPRIARVCADLGLTQELGEGIRRIYAEMQRIGLAEPLYTQGPESVRLTLFATSAVPESVSTTLGKSANQILDALRRAQRPLATGHIVEATDLARPTVVRHLNVLREAQLVVWDGDSPKDPRATWRLA